MLTFEGMRSLIDVILILIRWNGAYPLSRRDLE